MRRGLKAVPALTFAFAIWAPSATAQTCANFDHMQEEIYATCTAGGPGCTVTRMVRLRGLCGEDLSGTPCFESINVAPNGCTGTCDGNPGWESMCADAVSLTGTANGTACTGEGCGGAEACDGMDNDANGVIDEGVCAPEGECANFRTDPVHVGTGRFMTDEVVDVRYAGSAVPIEFVRHYTSADHWNAVIPNGLGLGWMHTFGEALGSFEGEGHWPLNYADWLISGEMRLGRRGPDGRGQLFTCATHPYSSDFTCASNDGSLDTLAWNAEKQIWSHRDPDGLTTTFTQEGRLLGKHDTYGAGWDVAYTSFTSWWVLIDYVQDHLGRRMDFIHNTWVLTELRDHSSGTTLATFTHPANALQLTSVTSAIGTEDYGYVAGHPRLLSSITRDGHLETSVDWGSLLFPPHDTTERVASVASHDGSYAFLYGSALCTNPTRSTAVVDRARSIGGGACTPGAAGDAYCQGLGQGLATCDVDTCRPVTCQAYAVNNRDELENVSGDCPCGTSETLTWTGTGAQRRVATRTTRSGLRTTYAYDSLGRVSAQCEGDDDSVVSTDPASCLTGVWTSTEYSATWPMRPATVRAKSRLVAGALVTITYNWATSHPDLLSASITGYTRSLTDVNTSETLTWTYTYEPTWGRLATVTGPAGEYTDFAYYNSPGSPAHGMLQQSRSRIVNGSTYWLTTSFSNYTILGMPQGITRPWSTSEVYGFAYGGMRLTSMNVGDGTTTFDYLASGKLWQINEPTGRRIRFSYDALGRLQYEDTLDSLTSSAPDRTEYAYDLAGLVSNVSRKRPSGAVDWSLGATYQRSGYQVTEAIGGAAPTALTYDPTLMGYLERIDRGDGDRLSMTHDFFGRETELRRYFGVGSEGAFTSSYTEPAGAAVNVGGDLPTRVTDAIGRTRDYTFDDFGQLVKSVGTDWGTMRWRYAQGRLVESKNPAQKRSVYSYDSLSRLTLINNDADVPANVGQDYRFVWDNGSGSVACGTLLTPCTYRVGRLAKVDMEVIASPQTFWTVEYAYNVDGQLGSERWTTAVARETKYEYDAFGRLVRVRMPVATGDMIRYDYDATSGDGLDPTEVVKVAAEISGAEYFPWARNITRDSLGRMLTARLADEGDAPTWRSVSLAYTQAGPPSSWAANRNNGGAAVPLMNRTYGYAADWMTSSYTSTVATTDPPRQAFHDGANRLTCVTNATGLGSCPVPPDSRIVNRLTYDAADNRATLVDSSGQTTYENIYNTLFHEFAPGGRQINYSYLLGTGGPRIYDKEVTAGYPNNQRDYISDGMSRVRVINVPRTRSGSVGVYDNHQITIIYDHLSRPIYIADKNTTVAPYKERREQLYWDLFGNLINRVITADSTLPNNYTVDIFAHVPPAVIGQMTLTYVGGTLTNEARSYILRDPTGLPASRYSFTGAGVTSTLWAAERNPFGEVRAVTSGSATNAPPFGFAGQYTLTGSQAERWNGSTVQQLRAPVLANVMRVYDQRVGQYTSPDPLTAAGSTWGNGAVYAMARGWSHAYAYAALGPFDLSDPLGLDPADQMVGDFFSAFGDRLSGAVPGFSFPPYGFAVMVFPQISPTALLRDHVFSGTGFQTDYSSLAYAVGQLAADLLAGAAAGAEAGACQVAANRNGPFSRVLLRTRRQLQHVFSKHARDFGINGNYNMRTLAELSRAIHRHINSPVVRQIHGQYRGIQVTHHLDTSTGLNVMSDAAGNLVSGWRLNAAQLANVLRSGRL